MLIDKEKCIGCEECIPYCPVGAIRLAEGGSVSEIDQDAFERIRKSHHRLP